MEDPTAVSIFHHEKFPDAATHIRLLEVLQAPEDGQMECRLSTWPIAIAPSYTAISYTWGEPADTTDIVVNSARLTVRSNCDYVLRQVSWQGPSYLWVDAICIDQTNNEEKSHQVRMMGDIYGNAKIVLACVGTHSDDSEHLCGFLRDHRLELSYFASQVFGYGLRSFYRPLPSKRASLRRLARSTRWRLRHSPAVHKRTLLALLAMLRRPYFQRAWIAQELYMADGPVLCCGIDTCDVTALYGLLLVSRHDDTSWVGDLDSALRKSIPWSRTPRLRRMFAASKDTCNLGPARFDLTHLYSIVALVACEDMMSTLLGLLKDARALQCADARDKIYALLSIMDSSTAQQIRVDYRQTCFELITNVLPVVLQDVELHSGPTEAAKPAHTCMYTISSAIRVQSDDESYLAAIAARRQAPHRLASTDDVESGGPRARLEMRGWVGCRLEQGRLERTCDRVADGLHSERSRNTTVHILDAGRDLLAITSNSIRPGDWILCPEGAIRDTWPGLVLREVPDESFGIISVVVFNHRVTRNDNAATVFDRAWGEAEIATFTVHFDLEDFSTVHHLYQSFFGYERPMLQLPMGLDSGVRMITGIPCTKFESWPWALETRSEDELEQYFSVGVCHGVDSSYVEKEAVPPSEQG